MRSFTFDIEADGLIPELTHVKCVNVIDNNTNLELRFTDSGFYQDADTGELTETECDRAGTITDGLHMLLRADEICGHNIVGYDIPAIQKLYPWFKPVNHILDTQVASRLLYPDISDRDALSQRKGKFLMDKKLAMKPHSLRAWGIRLGGPRKGDFTPMDKGWTWQQYPFSQECDDYCMDDVRVNVGVVQHFKKRFGEWSWGPAMACETAVNGILTRQMQYGWMYDQPAAQKLCATLMIEKLELEDSLQSVFAPWYVKDKEFTPKQDNKKQGYLKGAKVTKIKLTQFNPGSRDHIASRLKHLYDWHPEKFTPSGKAQVDETVLGELPWREAKECAKYFLVNKKLGQVAEGKAAQLRKVDPDSRMRGYVNHNGAITGRMTHSGPNVAQTDTDPRVRALYVAGPGKVLVGIDADGIEGRCLAHYLAAFDKGAYVNVILNGNKEDGTDLHSVNKRAVSMRDRDNAKTIFYAWMYGAGDPKLGTCMYDDWPAEKQAEFNRQFSGRARIVKLARIGKVAREKLVSGIDGMDKLIGQVKDRARAPGYVKGLDGRRVYTRSQHAALNTLLQSAGALIMKMALVLLDEALQEKYTPGLEYEFVGNIHDELQLEVDEAHAKDICIIAEQAFRDAGEWFKFRCPISATAKVGKNWAETH